jgi:hypothetical protein
VYDTPYISILNLGNLYAKFVCGLLCFFEEKSFESKSFPLKGRVDNSPSKGTLVNPSNSRPMHEFLGHGWPSDWKYEY